MKILISVSLMLFLAFPGMVFAKFRKDQTIVLLEPIQEGENIGSIDKLLDKPEQVKNINLIGEARMIKSPTSQKTLVQMVWTGVQNTEKNKKVALEKPLVSTFKFKNSVDTKGSHLSVEGEPEILMKAVQQLNAGTIDKEKFKIKQIAKNPKKMGRAIEMDHQKNKETRFKLMLPKNVDPIHSEIDLYKKPNSSTHSTRETNAQTSQAVAQNHHSFTHERGQGLAGPTSDNMFNSPRSQSGHANQNAITNRGLVRGIPDNTDAGFRRQPGFPQNPFGALANQQQNQANRPADPATNQAAVPNPVNREPIPEGGNQANRPADPLPEVQAAARPDPANREPIPPAENPAAPPAPNQAPNAPEPVVTFQVTEEGCHPRIDRVHERVTIKNRVKRLENAVVVDEGQCTDSMETYPIMKDYACQDCTDEVNNDTRRAYSRYQEYWFDRDNQRYNLGDTIYVDNARAHDFFERTTHCPLSIDLEGRRVYLQRETGYLNRGGLFTVVNQCHRIPNQVAIPITQTHDGCHMLHDFVNSVTYDQARLIFRRDNVDHEVRGCQQQGEAMRHQLVEMGCQRAVNLLNNTITLMYRRQITVAGRFLEGNQQFQARIITDECEPGPNHALQATRDNCEDQYVHDLNMGRSYLKKRYYYQNAGREYVSGCVRTNDYLAHQTQENGEWVHDDPNRLSTPRLYIYIEVENQRQIIVDPARVRGTQGQRAYVLTRNEHRPTNETYFEGCFRRTRTQSYDIYTRADNSVYENLLGPGNPVLSTVDECARQEESRTVEVERRGGNFWRHSRPVLSEQRRTITTFPDGTVQPGEWHF